VTESSQRTSKDSLQCLGENRSRRGIGHESPLKAYDFRSHVSLKQKGGKEKPASTGKLSFVSRNAP